MKQINYTRPFLYEYQKAILNSNARFTVTEASTKVGKTASHIIWLFEQALTLKENQSVWWVAPVGSVNFNFVSFALKNVLSVTCAFILLNAISACE
jgi:hypothetical protein